jgi:hypothetical protein
MLFVLATVVGAQTPSCTDLVPKVAVMQNSLANLKEDFANNSLPAFNRMVLRVPDPGGDAKLNAEWKQIEEGEKAVDELSSVVVEYGCAGEVTADMQGGSSRCAASRDTKFGSREAPIKLGKIGTV